MRGSGVAVLNRRPVASGDEDAGEVTMDMVRVEVERMAANVERMGSVGQVGGISSMMGELHKRLDEVRDRMVTREAYDRFFDCIRQLEVGVEAAAGMTNQERAFEGDTFFHEQSGDEGM